MTPSRFLLLTLLLLLILLIQLWTSTKNISDNDVKVIEQQELPPSHHHGLAITIAFNHKVDPQRNKVMKSNFSYIESWYNSIHRFPDITGVVIENMFNNDFRDMYADAQVSFATMKPLTHPSFTKVKNSLARSINDQRYFAFEWYLNDTYGLDFDVNSNDNNITSMKTHKNQYILLSDSHDVEFLKNPFEFMQTLDEIMSKHQLYIGEEFNQPREFYNWNNKKWKKCFGEYYPYTRILSAGIIGGHVLVIRKLLRVMNKWFLTLNAKLDCNMGVLQKTVQRVFKDNVVSGYPFNTKYMRYEKNSEAYIRHK